MGELVETESKVIDMACLDLCGCEIIVEQEDATYPPSVEKCPRTAGTNKRLCAIQDCLHKIFSSHLTLHHCLSYTCDHPRLLPPPVPTGSPLPA